MVFLSEEIKPEVPELLKWLAGRGIQTVLLSGDNAEKVARFSEAPVIVVK